MSSEVEKLIQKAQQAISHGKNDLAKKCYIQALKLRPDMPNLHYGLATVYYLLGDLEGAATHFKEVTRLDSVRAGAYINLGAVYNKLDRLDEALAALRKGIQLDLNRPEGYYNLALVYRRKGQTDLAIQAYREATRIEPRMADAHYNLANLYLEKGQHNLAIAHYEEALERRPNWEKAMNGLQAARTALAEELSEIADEPTTYEPDDTSETSTEHIFDPEETVNPQIHGNVLTDLHRATKESEKFGRDFVNLLQNEVEPAIKVLSSCLLYTERSATELDQCVQKLESALGHMNSTQKGLQAHLEEVQAAGVKLFER